METLACLRHSYQRLFRPPLAVVSSYLTVCRCLLFLGIPAVPWGTLPARRPHLPTNFALLFVLRLFIYLLLLSPLTLCLLFVLRFFAWCIFLPSHLLDSSPFSSSLHFLLAFPLVFLISRFINFLSLYIKDVLRCNILRNKALALLTLPALHVL